MNYKKLRVKILQKKGDSVIKKKIKGDLIIISGPSGCGKGTICSELIKNIESKLSKSEIEIFELKLKGLKNNEIASLIDKDKKFVENTMFRINKKYKEIINK